MKPREKGRWLDIGAGAHNFDGLFEGSGSVLRVGFEFCLREGQAI